MGATRLLGPAVLKTWLPAPRAASEQPASPPQQASQAGERVDLDSGKVVLAGRSVYYGVLVYAGYLAGKMWLTVALQALAVAYVLQLLMQRLWKLRTRVVVGTVVALSLLTPLGAYAGFLMPDVFAPLVILCMGTLAFYWQELPCGHC